MSQPKDVGSTGTALEQRAPVQPDYDYGRDGKQEIVPRLGVGPNGIHHLKMVQDRDQETAARIIEQRG